MNFLSSLRKQHAAIAKPGLGGVIAGASGTPAAVNRNAGLAQLRHDAAPAVAGPTWKDRLAIFGMALGDNDAGVAALNKKIDARGADVAKAAERRRLMDLARAHDLSPRETLAFITKPEAWAERNAGRDEEAATPGDFDHPAAASEAWSAPRPTPSDDGHMSYDSATGKATNGVPARSYGYDPARIIDGSGPAAGLPASAPGGAPVPNARKARDGKWYVPDHSRPGKYLRVD